MAKYYTKTVYGRPARPRSQKLQGLAGSSSAGGGMSSSALASMGNFSAFMAKFNSMFAIVDAQGNEVSNVEDAVAVKVKKVLSLLSEGEITAYLAPSTTP